MQPPNKVSKKEFTLFSTPIYICKVELNESELAELGEEVLLDSLCIYKMFKKQRSFGRRLVSVSAFGFRFFISA